MAWAVDQLESGDVHVSPVSDATAHVLSGECICGPTTEAVPGDAGHVGWMYTHHSLDGREQRERAAANGGPPATG